MQETEINPNLNHNLLSFPGYVIETETNSECARVAFYISTRINYVRRRDLEGNDSNIIVIDLEGDKKWRLINVYRSFAPQHNVTQRDKFVYQLGLIKQAFTTSSILLGDFNLDWQRRHDISYSHKNRKSWLVYLILILLLLPCCNLRRLHQSKKNHRKIIVVLI